MLLIIFIIYVLLSTFHYLCLAYNFLLYESFFLFLFSFKYYNKRKNDRLMRQMKKADIKYEKLAHAKK